MGTSDLSILGLKAARGSTQFEKGSAVVGAMASLSFYNPRLRPGEATPTPPDLLNSEVKLTLIKYNQDGSETRKSIPLKVIGI